MGDNVISDAILWIGQSYSAILCDQELEPFSLYCYSEGGRKRRCFVHEAEMRGCSRKIPYVPAWLVPRQSRIFLMYRDENSAERGALFGYFVLRRFEHIVSRNYGEIFTSGETIPWIEVVCQEIISAVLEKVEKARIGEVRGSHRDFIESTLRKEFDKRWRKGLKRRRCRAITIRPRPKAEPQWPSPDELLDKELTDFLEDVLEDIIQDWLEERIDELLSRGIDPDEYLWLDVDEDNGDVSNGHISVPRGRCMYEEPRYCSKRLKVGAVYAVDALAAAITDAFARELARKPPTTIKAGEALFRKTLIRVRTQYRDGTLTKLDSRIQEHAEIRGELVVFKRPYPVFERRPRAAFRGLLRVDGDELLKEVAEHYQNPGQRENLVLPLHREKKGDFFDPAFMAQEFGITKRLAEGILLLYGETLKSLEEGEEFVLPKIGTIKCAAGGFLFEAEKTT